MSHIKFIGGLNMNYKVGDKVKIKSLDWYNENKSSDDEIRCHPCWFGKEHSKWCGKVMTISDVRADHYTMIEDLVEYWTDEMIDCLVERNGKTYPYKIGDRVILKGKNRCATITDLKYNSQGNLSYYIKIDNDKDISIDYPTDLLLPYDNMIEGFVEEETKPESKFKVGDRIYPKYHKPSNNLEIIEVIRGDGHYGYRIKNHRTNNTYYMWEYEMSNYKLVEESSIDLTVKGEEVKERIEITIPEGYEYVIESGKIIFIKKKPRYPQTYEECCEIVKVDKNHTLEGEIIRKNNYKIALLESFQKLFICRDAYWKIAGEEMGLGKPWEPDWINPEQVKYTIYYYKGGIKKDYWHCHGHILAFPTEEMRDAFYEAFKGLIEECKELL